MSDVSIVGLREAAERGDFAQERFGVGLRAAITENHVGAVGSEAERNTAADAAGAAGDQRYSTIEWKRHGRARLFPAL
jgi:hypothetical protein